MAQDRKPNIVYFHADNLGHGDLGCYGGGILRGAETTRIDQFANEGFKMRSTGSVQCGPFVTAGALDIVFPPNDYVPHPAFFHFHRIWLSGS